eukprot:TRINITY_DN10465_c0_g1_i1.p1 TRINITY_DN10465_c0_g1~~TRINITY_DN10465_c0_g1_i1.p1  ORF type:complete len:321 (+),score=126.06 TRINITY_DN10465_c0_g1_i1:34-963(+)
MRVRIVWTDTDEDGYLDECDQVLGPDTSILDLKGLIKMWTDESVSDQVLVFDGKPCENASTFRELGLLTQADADSKHFSLMLEEDADTADPNGEFTHEEFIRAKKAIGQHVPVTKETLHQEEVRREAFAQKHFSRARPSKLQAPQKPDETEDDTSEVFDIFQKCKYGMRAEDMDSTLAIQVGSGEEGKFDFWDLRLPEDLEMRKRCERSKEMVMEIFYFGDIDTVKDEAQFKECVTRKVQEQLGLSIDPMAEKLRDAGCMYPLIALHIIVSHSAARKLGMAIFEHFGTPPPERSKAAGKTGQQGGCGTQ